VKLFLAMTFIEMLDRRPVGELAPCWWLYRLHKRAHCVSGDGAVWTMEFARRRKQGRFGRCKEENASTLDASCSLVVTVQTP
jgi:hypothetical protein